MNRTLTVEQQERQQKWLRGFEQQILRESICESTVKSRAEQPEQRTLRWFRDFVCDIPQMYLL